MATNNFYMNHKTSTTNSYSSNRKQCVYDTKINILPHFLMRMNPVCVATNLLFDMSGETYANSNKFNHKTSSTNVYTANLLASEVLLPSVTNHMQAHILCRTTAANMNTTTVHCYSVKIFHLQLTTNTASPLHMISAAIHFYLFNQPK